MSPLHPSYTGVDYSSKTAVLRFPSASQAEGFLALLSMNNGRYRTLDRKDGEIRLALDDVTPLTDLIRSLRG